MSVFSLDNKSFSEWLESNPDYDYVLESLRKGVEEFYKEFVNEGKYSDWVFNTDNGIKSTVGDESRRLYDESKEIIYSADPNQLPKLAGNVEEALNYLKDSIDGRNYMHGVPARLKRLRHRIHEIVDRFSQPTKVQAMPYDQELGPEYRYEIEMTGPEMALLSTWTSGMGPLYALVSRLYRDQGRATASERELDEVLDAAGMTISDAVEGITEDDKVVARGIIKKLSKVLDVPENELLEISAAADSPIEYYRQVFVNTFDDLYKNLFGPYATYLVEDTGTLESAARRVRYRLGDLRENPSNKLVDQLERDLTSFYNALDAGFAASGDKLSYKHRGYREVFRRILETIRRILGTKEYAEGEEPEPPLRYPNRPPFRDMGPFNRKSSRSEKGETKMELPKEIKYNGLKYVRAENPARPEKSALDEGKIRKELESQFGGNVPAQEYKYLDTVSGPSGNQSDAVTDTKEMNKRREDALKGKGSNDQSDLNSNTPNKIKYAGLVYVKAEPEKQSAATTLPPRIKYAGREYVRVGYEDAGEYKSDDMTTWKPGEEKGKSKKLDDYFSPSDSGKADYSERMPNSEVDFDKASEGIDPASSEPGPEKGGGENMPNEEQSKETAKGMPRLDGDEDRIPTAASSQPQSINYAGHRYVKVSEAEARRILAAKKKEKKTDLPKGWSNKSAKKFYEDAGATVTKCAREVKKLKKEGDKKCKDVDDPKAFCTTLEGLYDEDGDEKSKSTKSKGKKDNGSKDKKSKK